MLTIKRENNEFILVTRLGDYTLTPQDLQVLEAVLFPGYSRVPDLQSQVRMLIEHRDDLRQMLAAVFRGTATVSTTTQDASTRTES